MASMLVHIGERKRPQDDGSVRRARWARDDFEVREPPGGRAGKVRPWRVIYWGGGGLGASAPRGVAKILLPYVAKGAPILNR